MDYIAVVNVAVAAGDHVLIEVASTEDRFEALS
jgi:hypothetical protein